MKLSTKKGLRLGAVVTVAALSMGVLAGCASAATTDANASTNKTFNIWWYDDKTAQSKTWDAALTEFKTLHPDITVNFEQKTWDQIQKSGNSILDSDKAPDLSEWNKGNATAGSASAASLLTNLDDYAKQYKWDTTLPASALQVGQYTNGIMGSGSLYGVATYGEYVGWFYNKDMFAANNVKVPTSVTELEAALKTFKDAGVTPMAMAGGDYQIVHNIYALALSQADTSWVNNYQFFAAPTDFKDKAWTYAVNTVDRWLKAGYFEPNASGVKADESVASFEKGTYPMMMGGTWLDTGVAGAAKFAWGKFANPGTKSEGSAGNIWVIPSKSKQTDLAAEFINLTLSPKYQTLEGNNGGIPLLADPSTITDPTGKITNTVFNEILKGDGLGFYPDWPVPGFYEELLKDGTSLAAGTLAPTDYLTAVDKFYMANKP